MLTKILKSKIKKPSELDAYKFNIDVVNLTTIAGWAKRCDSDESTVTIEIRNDNVTLYECKANMDRSDLKKLGIGNGKYGFSIATPNLLLENDIEGIDIFIDGHKANLALLPLSLKAQKITPVKVNKSQKQKVDKPSITSKKSENLPSLKDIELTLDGSTITKVYGWARLKKSKTHRCKIELKAGETIIGRDTADKFRRSLYAKKIGDGRHAFHIVPDLHLFPSTKVHCELFVDGLSVKTQPIILETDKKTLEHAKFTHAFADEIPNFNESVNQELANITKQITEQNDNTVQAATQTAIENIALLSARIDIIERVLVKQLAVMSSMKKS